MMRVDWLITELDIAGGAETYTAQVVPRLRNKGVDIRVISLRSDGELVNRLRNQSIPVLELGIQSKLNLFPLYCLLRQWQKEPPDIVHTHLYHAGVVGRVLAKFSSIQHVLVHQHGSEINRPSLRTIIDRVSSPLVSKYIVTCQAVKNILASRESIPLDNIHIIYNGVDLDTFHYVNRGAYQRDEAPTVIGYIGRLAKEKNLPQLLAALDILKRKRIVFRVLIVGNGPERVFLENLAINLDLNHEIAWLGEQSNIMDWLQQMDIFVLPSSWEGISMALLEAMATGTPVVATEVGGTSEVVIPWETGILVPSGDINALSTALETCITNRGLRLQMGAAGRKRVEEFFSLEATTQQLFNIYRICTAKS
jgi:glycosyltransferase involved in cell wall biosynthesis